MKREERKGDIEQIMCKIRHSKSFLSFVFNIGYSHCIQYCKGFNLKCKSSS